MAGFIESVSRAKGGRRSAQPVMGRYSDEWIASRVILHG